LTREQADALKDQPDTPQGRRDAVLIGLMLDLGLRCGEAAGLTVAGNELARAEALLAQEVEDPEAWRRSWADVAQRVAQLEARTVATRSGWRRSKRPTGSRSARDRLTMGVKAGGVTGTK
jgi:site-specific recombinase XerC